ncbi:MAG: bifunctional DNA-binding transcriptional regulator/O6-methylguanine-DNA methyltransferase Ada [Actinomycetota bacterium]
MTTLDDARWEAVQQRSPGADGLFFYAVRTTGIYCRPVCTARRPKRVNVEFFATSADAVAGGYRPCKRCHPDRERVEDPTLAAVIAVCRWLEHPSEELDLAELSRRVGWSQRHLRRTFKETTGVTISAYARAQRAERVRAALRAGVPVTEAVYQAGYGSSRAFYEHGAPRLGTTPDDYRHGSPQAMIRFTIVATELGRVLIAATERGVCAVRIGDDDEALVTELAEEFEAAVILADDDALADVAAIVADLAAGRVTAVADVPLDLRGSAFQVEVWEALRSIEPGHVASYGQVAADLGRPSAHRAVANACAANPIALLVPCHRVVRSDGTAGGYRWGAPTKARLLAAEAATSTTTILFTDIVASTATTQTLGDRAAQDLIRAHDDVVRRALDDFGGELIKHTGDGIFATFPAATGAALAALDIAAGLDTAGIAVRIGINAGEPIEENDDLFGTAVQLAARVCDHAGPGQILATSVVRQLTAGKDLDWDGGRPFDPRGFDESVVVHRLRGRRRDPRPDDRPAIARHAADSTNDATP